MTSPTKDQGPVTNDAIEVRVGVDTAPLTRQQLGQAIVRLCAENGFHGVLCSFVGPQGYWVTYTAGMESWGLLKVAEIALTDAQRARDQAFNSPPPIAVAPTGGGAGGNDGGKP